MESFYEELKNVTVKAVNENRDVTKEEIASLIKHDDTEKRILTLLAISQILSQYVIEKLGINNDEFNDNIRKMYNDLVDKKAETVAKQMNDVMKEYKNGEKD